MSSRITFQFDAKLAYQEEAITSAVDLFRGMSRKADSAIYRNLDRMQKAEYEPVRNPPIIPETRLLNNLRDIQVRNSLFVDQAIMNNNFSLEMETGTGKTYVYLRTILELYKTYRFTKFMIIVPSVAIRKGVEKSIDMLRDHFKALYDGLDLKNHAFVYDSNNPKKVSGNFIETGDLSIVIINIQAFNKEANKLRQADEYGQILWEDIKAVQPIVIMDEPQKIEGTARKKTASLEAIEMLHPLFTLRYSATHKRLFNQVYKLNSYDAFQKDLVKKIEVKTVQGTISKDFPYIRYVGFTKDLYAKIEIFFVEPGGVIRSRQFSVRGGADLYELSGHLPQYKNKIIQQDPHRLRKLKIGLGERTMDLAPGENNLSLNETEIIRIQIRLAIKTHLEKQFNILKKGYQIKVLTLFFINAVRKFRDTDSPDGRGEYLRIFDEEYARIIADPKWRSLFEQYPERFREYQRIYKVREGYFAVDRQKNAVEVEEWDSVLDERKLKAKSQQDVDRGIELILEKKDELISFDEPLAFIFSHSALREGWDNPNVFTICTLKQGSSEIAKKQEIGRGLRLPVDISGIRCLDSEINELTVIANESYDQFAAALQQDFNEQAGFNQNEVTADVIYKTLEKAGISREKITAELVGAFRAELAEQKMIDSNNTLVRGAKALAAAELVFHNETLQEYSHLIKEKFIAYMLAKGTTKIPIRNGDEAPARNGPERLTGGEPFGQPVKQATDRVKIDSDAFIAECISQLNDSLRYKKIHSQYEVGTGKAGFTEQKEFRLGGAASEILYEDKAMEARTDGKSDFEIVNYIMYHTMLPRLAIFKILSGLEKKTLLKNQDLLDMATQKIRSILKEFKARDIAGN